MEPNMPEVKLDRKPRVFRRAAKQRAIAVHRTDEIKYLQGTELDRLCEGLPNERLSKEINRHAVAVTKKQVKEIKVKTPPLRMVRFADECIKCNTIHNGVFGYLFRRYESHDGAREVVVAHPDVNEDVIYVRDEIRRIPCCSYCTHLKPEPESPE